jgi:transposase-like protein
MMLVERIGSGRPIAHVAAEMGVSRKTATKWWRRFQEEGPAGLEDRSSRPRRCPHHTPARVEARILRLRQKRKLGPARISSILDVPPSTVHQVLVRAGMNRIAWMDRPTGQVIRRIHTDRPGELVHVDVKKLGRIPPGGGWRMLGRDATPHRDKTRVGYDFVHSAIDAHTRMAYSEVHSDERGPTCAGFWTRALDRFLHTYNHHRGHTALGGRPPISAINQTGQHN